MTEYMSVADQSCDRCCRINGPLKWHPIGQGMNYLCRDCIAYQAERDGIEESLEQAWRDAGYHSSLEVQHAEGR